LLTLIAPNTFSSDWLRKNYCETIEKAAKEICGHEVKVVFKSETNTSSSLTNEEKPNEQNVNHKTRSFSSNNQNNSSKNNELYAIAETSGQQFWFEVNRYYDIDRLKAKEKDKITLEKVLLLKDKDSITVGKPYVKDAKIELEVVSHRRDKKILVYKMRPKKKTRRKMGHRQELTRVMVKSITIGKSTPKSSVKKETVKKETKPKSEKSTN